MSDESTSNALVQASAYLDGELDASEMKAAEADPAVMAEVTRLREVQAAIRDVPAPSSYARDLAIDAALAEFDRIRQPVVPAVRVKPRPSYGRWMAVAAAIAGVAALGAVITATTRGGGDDFDASSAPATTEQADVAFDSAAADRSTSGGSAPAAPQPEAAQSQTMLSAAAEPPATAAAAAGAAEASQESAAATTAAAASTAAPAATTPASDTFAGFDPNTPINDDVDLGRIGRALLAEWQSGARESKVGTPCDNAVPGAVLLSDALLIVDGASRKVLIAADPQTDNTFALDPISCVVLMTGR